MYMRLYKISYEFMNFVARLRREREMGGGGVGWETNILAQELKFYGA